MKWSRHQQESIAFALRQAESGTPIVDMYRKMGIAGAGVLVVVESEKAIQRATARATIADSA